MDPCLTLQHVNIGIVRNGKDVGRHFGASLATVHVNNLLSVNREVPVGIDNDAEKARVGLKENVKKIKSITDKMVCNNKQNFVLLVKHDKQYLVISIVGICRHAIWCIYKL